MVCAAERKTFNTISSKQREADQNLMFGSRTLLREICSVLTEQRTKPPATWTMSCWLVNNDHYASSKESPYSMVAKSLVWTQKPSIRSAGKKTMATCSSILVSIHVWLKRGKGDRSSVSRSTLSWLLQKGPHQKGSTKTLKGPYQSLKLEATHQI